MRTILRLFLMAAWLMFTSGGCDHRDSPNASLPTIVSSLQSMSACLQLYVTRHHGQLPAKLDELNPIAAELGVSGVVEFTRQRLNRGDWIYFAVPSDFGGRGKNDLLIALPFPLYRTSRGVSVEEVKGFDVSAFRYCVNCNYDIVKVDEAKFAIMQAKGGIAPKE
jgi:hypothetical protein